VNPVVAYLYRNNLTLLGFIVVTVLMFWILTGIFGDNTIPDDTAKKLKDLSTENGQLMKDIATLKRTNAMLDIQNAEHIRQDSIMRSQLEKNQHDIDSIHARPVTDFSNYGSDKLYRYFTNIR